MGLLATASASRLDAAVGSVDTSARPKSGRQDALICCTDSSSPMPGWPYPSYADRRWLGGDRGPDKALAGVVRALRGLVAETGGSVDPSPPSLLHALAQLADLGERVEWAMLSVIGEARTE